MEGLKEKFDLQLDKFLKRYGMKKATQLLYSLVNPSPAKLDEQNNKRLITEYLTSQAAQVFGVTKSEIQSAGNRSAKEARWATVHLLKFYTRYTYKRLCKLFDANERQLKYACKKCSELLEVPRFEKEFNRKYQTLENNLIAFMNKINE